MLSAGCARDDPDEIAAHLTGQANPVIKMTGLTKNPDRAGWGLNDKETPNIKLGAKRFLFFRFFEPILEVLG
jgi:hypothetical protein